MRVCVTGGRNYSVTEKVTDALSALSPSVVIHGGASGVDTIAGSWATLHDIPVMVFPANWKVYGPSTGPIRNRQMLVQSKPDVLVVFPGGKGTANCKQTAKDLGIKIIVVEE